MEEKEGLLTADQYATYKHWMVSTEYMDAYLNRMLTAFGLTMTEYRMMVVLTDAPGQRLRMSDLASDARHSLSRSSHTIARMESRGWVKRVPHDSDRRVIFVTPTPEGLELFERARPAYHANVRRIFVDAIGEDLIEAIDGAAQRIISSTTAMLR